MIECKCGCGEMLEEFDKYGRKRSYISGHNGRKYSDPSQHKREWNHRNRESRYTLKTKSITAFKKELIIEKGGKCRDCGLKLDDTNMCVFDFHHRDPKTKVMGINKSTMNKVAKQKIRDEAEKCDLLCSNCHRLKHWGGK